MRIVADQVIWTNRKGRNPMPQHTEPPKAALEIWVMVNEDGEYVATHDEDSIDDFYSDSIGGTPRNCRTVKLTLIVAPPQGVDVSVFKLAQASILRGREQ
jgi:hypothetical protein